jgi:uncharacterized membrane protein SpoIIM required for sporulation
MKKSLYRWPAILTGIVCLTAIVNGLLLPAETSRYFLKILGDYLKGISFSFPGIFFNNLKAALVLFFGGFIIAIPTIFLIYFNFLLIGIVLKDSIAGGTVFRFIVSIAPHGIFEIPAIFISCVFGVAVSYQLFRLVFTKEKPDFGAFFIQTCLNFLKIVIPLLIIAALIEVYVTPAIIHYFHIK